MNFIKHSFRYAAVAAGLALSSASFADNVFSLQGVTFSDGGAASGTFSLNVYDNLIGSSIAINTTSGGILGAGSYPSALVASSFVYGSNETIVDFYRSGAGYANVLQLQFLHSLATPGYDPIVIGANSFESTGFGSAERFVTAGAAVPEMPIPGMLAAGMGLLTFVNAKRRQSV